ncbi:MAG: 16S rRNA (guanine(966)-N(2))-methyltransferase RsmD [Phycisphaerales bacterium]|nr:16S rRNA (guanine(966)-N(2))-methyltransferase RsmD [Phycisphaerales bacterium]
MRIIAGQYRGRIIAAPEGRNTRPILDRAKTVLFDILGHYMAEPGRLPPLAVLDLFAGSGALGVEALSRGAAYCLFVEQHRPTAALIRKNLGELNITDAARVIEGPASKCVFPPPPAPFGVERYGLVFIDPPYRILAGPKPGEEMRTLLARLPAEPTIDSEALIVIRHAYQPAQIPDLAPLFEYRRQDVGTMTLRFMTIKQIGNGEGVCTEP